MNYDAYVYIPEDLRGKIPPLYATENDPNPVVWVKLFTPDSSWAWYITEFDGADTCFGLVVGHAVELGYFSLAEIAAARGPLGLRIERDMFLQPQPIQKFRSEASPQPFQWLRESDGPLDFLARCARHRGASSDRKKGS